MNTKKPYGLLWAVIALTTVIGAVFLIGKGNRQGPVQSEVKIGVIGILSGEYAIVGENIQKGIILAEEEYNASGNGPKFTIISEDDGFDTKKGVSAYQKLTSVDNVSALINTSSPTIDAIYGQVTKKGFPVIQFGNQGVDPSNDNVIQVTAGNRPLELALGKITKKKYPDNVAVYYGGDAVFTKFFKDFKEGYGDGLTEYTIKQTSEDPRETATKMLAKGHNVVVIISSPTDGAKLINELLRFTKKPLTFIFDANMQSGIIDYGRIIGDISKLDGSYVMSIITVKSQEFVNNYKKRFGSEPGFWADYGYDGFMTLAKGYDKNNQKWIDNIKKSDFSGASGKIIFDEVGVLKPEFELEQLKNGEFVKVD